VTPKLSCGNCSTEAAIKVISVAGFFSLNTSKCGTKERGPEGTLQALISSVRSGCEAESSHLLPNTPNCSISQQNKYNKV